MNRSLCEILIWIWGLEPGDGDDVSVSGLDWSRVVAGRVPYFKSIRASNLISLS